MSKTEKVPQVGSKEYFVMLGFTSQEAGGFATSWAYKAPEDAAESQTAAINGSRSEELIRGLNYDLRVGRITQQEYDKAISNMLK